MGIRKSEIFSIFVCIGFLLVTGVVHQDSCVADTKSAVAVLASTYKSSSSISVSEAESSIAMLEQALGECGDDLVSLRIRYRIGVLSFRAKMFDAAKGRFAALARDGKCSALIRVCSYNMIGQISRLAGEGGESLEAFNKVAELSSQALSSVEKDEVKSVLEEVLLAVLLSRAEIFQLNGDYVASIGEYKRLLRISGRARGGNLLGDNTAMVRDRISQLYLRQGDVEKYIEAAEELVLADGEYRRRGIIELEMACVKFLNGVDSSIEFAEGSFEAPAKVIAYVKDQERRASMVSIVDEVGKLYERYSDGYGAMVVAYHYAWLLDALGAKDEAAQVFGRISSGEIGKIGGQACNVAIAKTIRAYAKIQYAIMLGETCDYREALRVLSGVVASGEETHISKLTESVRESIQILKREVPKDENEQR